MNLTDSLTHFLSIDSGSFTWGQTALALLSAYLGGILASLTPCVYPMIPITVSVVAGLGESKKQNWKDVLSRGVFYVAGMTLIYSILGVLAGLTGQVFGSMTQTAGWYLGLGIVMNLSALIMLDIIPFDPMIWWDGLQRKLGRPPKKHLNYHERHAQTPLLGAFVLGASSGFIAAPCTTPVLTAILAYIAKTQSVGLGLGLMIAFSFGLGTLLLIIASFAGAVRVFPRSGQWMKAIKVLSGILLLVFAEYLIYTAGQRGGV